MGNVAQLRWRCRRGMRELDHLTTGYLERIYPSAEAGQQAAFRALLDLADPDLWALLMGQSVASTDDQRDVIERMRQLS